MNAWAHNKKGFTVVELLIVIVIIGILASITIVSFTSTQQRSRDETRTSDISKVQRALEKYHTANGVYPPAGVDNTTPAALSALSSALVPTYLDKIPTPPSAATYEYMRGLPSADSYGIRMGYETKPNCHRGINNESSTWWGSLTACRD